MLVLIGLLVYSLVIGVIAQLLHPGPNPAGCLPAIAVGFSGTFIGGFIEFLLGKGQFGGTSGIIFSVIGGVIALIIWRWLVLLFSPEGPRSFWTGELK